MPDRAYVAGAHPLLSHQSGRRAGARLYCRVAAREREDWGETLALLGELGLEAPVSLRQLEGKVWEIRVGRHRIAYVVVSGPELILLHAFKK